MRKALIYVLTAFMLIALLSGCDAPDKTGNNNTNDHGEESKNETALDFKLDKDTDTYTVTGIGKFSGEALEIPAEYNEKAVTAIGDHAFMANTKIKSVSLPDSITNIGEWAFCDCENLSNITLPNGIERIGADAFSGTAYFKNEEKWDNGALYIGNYLVSVKKDQIPEIYEIKPETTAIADFIFNYCEELKSVTVPDSVTTIGERAFAGCSSLKEITFDKSIKHIGEGAFFECTALESIIFNGTVIDWENIIKDANWDYYSSIYTVTCSDGIVEPEGK